VPNGIISVNRSCDLRDTLVHYLLVSEIWKTTAFIVSSDFYFKLRVKIVDDKAVVPTTLNVLAAGFLASLSRFFFLFLRRETDSL